MRSRCVCVCVCVIFGSLLHLSLPSFLAFFHLLTYSHKHTHTHTQKQAPIDFTTTPSLAIPVALKRANLTPKDIDFYEINEAFAVVALANAKLLNIDLQQLNVNGGRCALKLHIYVNTHTHIRTPPSLDSSQQ